MLRFTASRFNEQRISTAGRSGHALANHGIPFYLSELEEFDPSNSWFKEDTTTGLTGRCLLDVLEYLRVDPKYPGRFRHVMNAHTIRLASRYLSNDELERKQVLDRLKSPIEETYRKLLKYRNPSVPFYGDDFWDWASVLEAFVVVQQGLPFSVDVEQVTRELRTFYDTVKKYLSPGLATNRDGEWYGPATAAIACRVLNRSRHLFQGEDVDDVLRRLRTQALEPIQNGKYRDRNIPAFQVLWHCGQVVAEFPRETAAQRPQLEDLSCVQSLEKTERVYALARVLQGALALKNVNGSDQAAQDLYDKAIDLLYQCQNLGRPLGQGLMGDTVKGSLNVLEAIWRA